MQYYDNNDNQLNNENRDNNEIAEIGHDMDVGKRKMKFTEQFINSVSKPATFISMSDNKTSSFVKYYLLLMLIAVVMVTLIPTAATIAGFGGFEKLFKESVPKFSVSGGKLISEKEFQITTSNVTFYMNPAVDKIEDMQLADNSVYMLFTRSEYALSYIESGKAVSFARGNISTLLPEGTTNESLIAIIPYIYWFFFFYAIVTFVQLLAKYAILALLYMLLASSLNRLSGLRLSGGELFKICIYAQTIGILAVNLNIALGVIVPSLIVSVAGIFVSYIYIKKAFKDFLPKNPGIMDGR